jgi:hypothetical protein
VLLDGLLGERPERVEPDMERDRDVVDRSSSAVLKWSPAVGAAAEPASCAKTVW